MSQLKIGWASRDVSTEKPVNIPGQFHMRISEGIMDPVTVSALVIDNGTDIVIFLSADLVVIRSGLLDEIRIKTAKINPQIPVQKILMNATHTHSAPSHYAEKTDNNITTPLILINEVPHEAQERRYKLKYDGIDIDNRVNSKNEIYNRLDIAERIANAFTEVYEWARKDIKTNLPIEHIVETLNLSRRIITDEEYMYAKEELAKLMKQEFTAKDTPKENLFSNSILVAGRNRYKKIIDRYISQKSEPKLPMELHVIKIGDIAFASNRFELYMDYQHRIQARSPFEQTFIVQLSGQPGYDGGTYLATDRGAQGKGYSASMFCNLVSPEGGQELVEETIKLLKNIYPHKDDTDSL